MSSWLPLDRLIRLVDNVALKLVVNGSGGVISTNSLVLAVRPVDGRNFPATSIIINTVNDIQVTLVLIFFFLGCK